ncbi:MAG: iron-sulfur cluster assembly protein [Acidobacteria bacterium]|nr:iron-sulfur cluster assembly protein [Acidobacteriota bacterium]
MSSYNPLSILGRPEPRREAPPSTPEILPEAAVPAPSAATPGVTDSDAAVELKPINPAPGSVEERVVDAIKECYDPEIPVNIYELGLIYSVGVNPEEHATISMTLTAPNCPAAQSLPLEVQRRVELVSGVKTAEVNITFTPPWTPDLMTDAAKLQLNIL